MAKEISWIEVWYKNGQRITISWAELEKLEALADVVQKLNGANEMYIRLKKVFEGLKES
jgi:hypothetical protein